MPTQREIDQTIIMFHLSRDAHDYVDYSRKPGWLDRLPPEGLEDFCNLLESVWKDVRDEMHRRELPISAKKFMKSRNSSIDT